MALKDETGNPYGALTVIRRAEGTVKTAHWVCACSCGGECVARGDNLRKGRTTHCGCGATPGSKNLSRGPVVQPRITLPDVAERIAQRIAARHGAKLTKGQRIAVRAAYA